ncbi:MAG: hypothetical protein WCO93_05015 [bacterium]
MNNRMVSRKILYLILLLPFHGFGQNGNGNHKFWQLTSLNGAIQVGGHYRYQEGTTNEIYNYQKSSRLYGGILANTTSYFYHPNLLSLDLGVEFNPEIGKDLFLVVPDQAEVRTMQKINIAATLFRQRTFTLGAFFNYNMVYTNRENLSNIKSNGTNWGANLNFSNKILPFQASYQQSKWHETEIATGRTFLTNTKNFQARIDKSFSSHDNNELTYSHNDYFRQDALLYDTRNISDNLLLNNTIYFDHKRNYYLISNISGIDQRGNDAFRRFQIDEGVSLNLPMHFILSTNYFFYNYHRATQDLNQHQVSGTLRHKLYQSLTTGISGEYNSLVHTFYKEQNSKTGIEILYEKKIPLKGLLALSYVFNWQRQNRQSDPVQLPILHEEHTLTDGRIVLLDKAFVDPSTVVIKDVTGTIIYQPDFDYLLIQRNDFLEIQRIPGGQIPNNGKVYADYISMQPGSYRYDVLFNNLNASISLWNRLVEVYYRFAKQDYFNLVTAEYLTLNYFTQQIAGCRLEYRFANGGVEYENYNSSIIPYRMMKYYVALQGNIKGRFTFSLNGNLRQYNMLEDNTRQTYADIIGAVGYNFGPQTRVSLEVGYRKQVGKEIDLNLLTARTEFTTVFRQVFFKIGFEIYGRDYLSERTNFFGGYVQIVRNFNWHKK